MIITCNKCNSSFDLDERLLKQTGSKVRCSVCSDIFVAYPPVPEEVTEKPIEDIPDLDAETEPQVPESKAAEETEETLEDLGFEIDTEAEADETPEAAEPEAAADDDLSLEDLDLDLEMEPDVDAAVVSADMGSAWTLLYPDYTVVPIKTDIKWPVGYPVAGWDQELGLFMNRWIDMKKQDGTIQKEYDYWILGQATKRKQPRWSVIRNVLHWVE